MNEPEEPNRGNPYVRFNEGAKQNTGTDNCGPLIRLVSLHLLYNIKVAIVRGDPVLSDEEPFGIKIHIHARVSRFHWQGIY